MAAAFPNVLFHRRSPNTNNFVQPGQILWSGSHEIDTGPLAAIVRLRIRALFGIQIISLAVRHTSTVKSED